MMLIFNIVMIIAFAWLEAIIIEYMKKSKANKEPWIWIILFTTNLQIVSNLLEIIEYIIGAK